MRALGWTPVTGESARERSGYLAASDDARFADLDAAIRSPSNDAIWCLRGGYGTMRIIERLDLAPLRARPRPLIGFSDNTALHLLMRREGLVSFHGPHPGTEGFSDFSRDCLISVLTEPEAEGPQELPPCDESPPVTVVAGTATGKLVGGNLSLLAATVGTCAEVSASSAILVIEEVGEPLYRVDRMLTQLRLAGTLNGVAGIVVGAISARPDAEDERLPSVTEVLYDRLGDLGVPVAHGFPFGHVTDSWTIPLGVHAMLDADAGTLKLLEATVTA